MTKLLYLLTVNQSLQRLINIVQDISFPGYGLEVKIKGSTPYLQLSCQDMCAKTGKPYTWKSRKWMLSYHMTQSEVVQTCFLAVKTAMMHEVHELFKWRNEPVFRPHFDVTALHSLSATEQIEVRNEQEA